MLLLKASDKKNDKKALCVTVDQGYFADKITISG